MHHPKTVRLPIPDDACAVAREMISHGLYPATMLEFMRGDVVCLRGTARVFASREVSTNSSGTPVHVPYKGPRRTVAASPVRKAGAHG
jgi:hypothetical protein